MMHRIFLPAVVFMCVGCAAGGDGAPAATATASIENIEWQLTRLGTTPAVIANPQNAPRLTLQSADGRATGSGGCNRLMGSYTLEGSKLKFGQMAGTMMACPQGMEQERAFHEALAKVAGWRLNGAVLELLDATGQPVLSLQQKR